MSKRFSIGSKYEYCPNGNYWENISGIFDSEIFLFCDCKRCDGQIYVLRARKFKLDSERQKELVDDLRKQKKLEEVRSMVNISNMDRVTTSLKGKLNDTN